LIDDGETDWKVFVVNVDDMDVTKSMGLTDVKKPEDVTAIVEWFRNYKTAEGKGLNTIGLDEKILSAEETKAIVMETHVHWKKLMSRRVGKAEEL